MISVDAFLAKVEPLGAGLSLSAMREGGEIIRDVVVSGGYRKALEIGTYRGVTAAFLAHLCERVVTIDLADGKLERRSEEFSREAFWRALGLNNIEMVLIHSDADKAAAIAPLEFDFAFIDGDHSAPAVDFALVRRCGAVLFHDYIDDRNGVSRLVRTLPPSEVSVRGNFAFWRRLA